MAIYRKGENQFELHESARLGQNRREMDRRKSVEDINKVKESPLEAMAATNFMAEDISRQIAYEAGLEDVTVESHKTQNRFMNAIAESAGLETDMSVPISGDDLARGAAGKKALEALKDLN